MSCKIWTGSPIDDAIAERYVVRLYIVLIGEHPSLRPPGSMGVYFTYQVRWVLSTGTDCNCIADFHKNRQSYKQSLKKLPFLINESENYSFRRQFKRRDY
ncbi:MAG: ethanolamine ammonia-lyase light chain EutC [Methylococcaceae bacterium]